MPGPGENSGTEPKAAAHECRFARTVRGEPGGATESPSPAADPAGNTHRSAGGQAEVRGGSCCI